MMFLVRSAFWLGIVYSSMPFDRDEALRAVGQTQDAIVAGAVATARTECLQNIASCRAILTAAGGTPLATSPERPAALLGGAARTTGKGENSQPSANSLNAADLATPWRGRRAKPALDFSRPRSGAKAAHTDIRGTDASS
jgi:hypothetical protein